MSRYFDGYASFDYKEMSKEKLVCELKEKVRYIGQIKREHQEEISSIQSTKDKQIKQLQDQLSLTEKALIVAYKEHKKDSTPANWIYHISKEEYLDFIKTKAKEMMESE